MATNLTAGDLVGILKDLPPETPVFVRGYEDGVNYVTSVEPTKVRLFENSEWYYGQHEIDPDGPVEGVELTGAHVPNPSNETSNA
jgi:hypothetical protein